jgi:peptidoglycan lytic transglycosylase
MTRMRSAGVLSVIAMLASSVAAATQLPADDDAAALAWPWYALKAYEAARQSSEVDVSAIVRAAQAELSLGRPERALAILSENPVADTALAGAAARTFAMALFSLGDYGKAGALFDRVAEGASGSRRGTFAAQAGVAYERAGLMGPAANAYRRAALDLPEIEGWLALRVARVTSDTAEALAFLKSVPVAGRGLAARVRATLFESAGDTVKAAAAYEGAGDQIRAAQLYIAIGRTADARRLLFAALRSNDPDIATGAADLLLEQIPPETSTEHTAVARALARHRRAKDAARLFAQAISLGDSTSLAFLQLAEATAAAGDRWKALEILESAKKKGDDSAPQAAFARARLLVQLNQSAPAIRALREFVVSHPNQEETPRATYLLADLEQDAGRLSVADSLYRVVTDAWPDTQHAALARLRLGSNALNRADTAAAIAYFRAASARDGEQAQSALFQLGELHLQHGDTVQARDVWMRLAVEDSIGYYGTIARQAASLPPPYFAPLPARVPTRAVLEAWSELDLLEACQLYEEADAHIDGLTRAEGLSTEDLIEFAFGLSARGRTVRSIRIGWRLSADYGLNDPRIIRLIFPWPNQAVVHREASRFKVDPFLLAALIRQESAFDVDATSRAGARGLMQLMPTTAKAEAQRLGVEWDQGVLGIAEANVHLGTAHLAALLKRYDGDVIPTLAAYNAGGSRVTRWLRYPEASDPVRFVERIPYRETRAYVKSVIRNLAIYRALYDGVPIP